MVSFETEKLLQQQMFLVLILDQTLFDQMCTG